LSAHLLVRLRDRRGERLDEPLVLAHQRADLVQLAARKAARARARAKAAVLGGGDVRVLGGGEQVIHRRHVRAQLLRLPAHRRALALEEGERERRAVRDAD
jgi:hypothetical protein